MYIISPWLFSTYLDWRISLWSIIHNRGALLCIGGPALVQYLRPTEEELFQVRPPVSNISESHLQNKTHTLRACLWRRMEFFSCANSCRSWEQATREYKLTDEKPLRDSTRNSKSETLKRATRDRRTLILLSRNWRRTRSLINPVRLGDASHYSSPSPLLPLTFKRTLSPFPFNSKN